MQRRVSPKQSNQISIYYCVRQDSGQTIKERKSRQNAARRTRAARGLRQPRALVDASKLNRIKTRRRTNNTSSSTRQTYSDTGCTSTRGAHGVRFDKSLHNSCFQCNTPKQRDWSSSMKCSRSLRWLIAVSHQQQRVWSHHASMTRSDRIETWCAHSDNISFRVLYDYL